MKNYKKKSFQVWFSPNPQEVKIETITTIIKKSKLAILCVSDSFAQDEKCIQVFELIKNIIKKNYLLVEFGALDGRREWIENPVFVSVCSDFRIIMQDPKRYGHKLAELLEILDRQVRQNPTGTNKSGGGATEEKDKPVDVFISYCWANSSQAVAKGTKPGRDKKGNVTSLGWLDPRTLVKFFKVFNKFFFFI